jgi:hypothetical protein
LLEWKGKNNLEGDLEGKLEVIQKSTAHSKWHTQNPKHTNTPLEVSHKIPNMNPKLEKPFDFFPRPLEIL